MALGATFVVPSTYTITSIAAEQPGQPGTTFRVSIVGAAGSLVITGLTNAQAQTAWNAMQNQATVTATLT